MYVFFKELSQTFEKISHNCRDEMLVKLLIFWPRCGHLITPFGMYDSEFIQRTYYGSVSKKLCKGWFVLKQTNDFDTKKKKKCQHKEVGTYLN